MNKNLLKTYVVKSQLERWLRNNKSWKYILKRLWEIHKIEITKEELEEFIEKENLK